MASVGQRQMFGVFELEWSWPLQREVLGLDLVLRTDSGINRIRIPSQTNAGALHCELPNGMEPAGRPWGRTRAADEFRVYAVGFSFFSDLRRYSLRVGELDRSLALVSEWIAWSCGEPLHVEPRIHVHEVPLFIGSTQQMLSSMHRKIEHQGSGGIYASAVEVNRAFTKVSEGEPLTISRSLWCEAKSYLSRRQDRQALVAAVSAAEVAVEQAIQRHFESILQPETVASVLKRAGGIVEKLRILEAERVLPPGLPSIGKGIDIAGARNQAIHSGSWPERSTAAEAVEWSRKVVIELDADG